MNGPDLTKMPHPYPDGHEQGHIRGLTTGARIALIVGLLVLMCLVLFFAASLR